MFKKYYLAYGSNLNLENMMNRCPSAKIIGTIMLNDYRLVYKGKNDNYSYLTIERCDGYSIPMAVYEITLTDLLSLDDYEGYPWLYSKSYVPLNIEGKKRKALIYIMNLDFDYHLPSQEYIDICMEGYEDFEFDKNILEQALLDTKRNISKTKRK